MVLYLGEPRSGYHQLPNFLNFTPYFIGWVFHLPCWLLSVPLVAGGWVHGLGKELSIQWGYSIHWSKVWSLNTFTLEKERRENCISWPLYTVYLPYTSNLLPTSTHQSLHWIRTTWPGPTTQREVRSCDMCDIHSIPWRKQFVPIIRRVQPIHWVCSWISAKYTLLHWRYFTSISTEASME